MHAAKKKRIDTRRWQRIPLAVPVFLRGVDSAGREFLEFATALNISAGGALVAMRRQLPRCERLLLEIPVAPLPIASPVPKAARKVKAKLVRVSLGDDFQLWGLKFASVLGERQKESRPRRSPIKKKSDSVSA